MKIAKIMPVMMSLFMFICTVNAVEKGLNVEEKEDSIILENEFIKVEIISFGGKIKSFFDKLSMQEYADCRKIGRNSGFMKDRIWELKGHNEIRHAQHQLKVVKKSENLITVRSSFTGKKAITKGFEFVKNYTLKRGECRLQIEYRVFSHSVWGDFSPWLHNLFILPKDFAAKKQAYVFCQMQNGLFCQNAIKPQSGDNLLFDPKEPWIGIVSEKSADGILQITEKHPLSHFYCWMGHDEYFTMELVFVKNKFSPDGSWMTNVAIMPTKGLKSYHFATNDYAGGFTMENGKSCLKIFPTVSMEKTKVTVFEKDKELAKTEVDAVAGKVFTIPVKIDNDLHKYKVIVQNKSGENEHEITASPKIQPSKIKAESNISANKNAKENEAEAVYTKKVFYVSPEMPTILSFAMRETFKKKGKEVELVLEFPEGVECAPSAKATKEAITIDGKKYNRFAIKTRARNYMALLRFFITSNWEAGKKDIGYFYVRWPEGQQKKQKVTVESVHIESAPVPKRLIAGLGWYGIGLYDSWPDFFNNYKKLGLNTVCTTSWDLAKMDKLKVAVKRARDNGMWIGGNYSPFLKRRFTAQVIKENAQVENMDGVKKRFVCPSYRGKAFQDEVEKISDYAKAGISMLWYDAEIWRGSEFCFCERCMKRFKKYMAKNHPDMKYPSPKEFERDSAKYPKLHEIWLEFRISLGTEMFDICRDRYYEKIKKYGAKSSPFPIIGSYAVTPDKIYHQFLRFNEQYKSGALNACMPSLYVAGDAMRVATTVKKIRDYMKNSQIIPWLSAGYGILSSECESVDVKYMVLENFMNGAMGFTTFTWNGFDGLDFKYLADAMRMVVPVEDIIVDGQPIEGLNSSNKDVKLCGLVKGDEQLILVSEYYKDSPTKTTFEIDVTQDCNLVDMESNKVLKKLKKGRNKIDVTLDKCRAKLLYLGNKTL